MKFLAALFAFALFLLLLGFAIKNMGIVEMHYYLGFVWSAPLSLMLLLSMMLGVILGVIASMSTITKMRKQVIALKHELTVLGKQANQ